MSVYYYFIKREGHVFTPNTGKKLVSNCVNFESGRQKTYTHERQERDFHRTSNYQNDWVFGLSTKRSENIQNFVVNKGHDQKSTHTVRLVMESRNPHRVRMAHSAQVSHGI